MEEVAQALVVHEVVVAAGVMELLALASVGMDNEAQVVKLAVESREGPKVASVVRVEDVAVVERKAMASKVMEVLAEQGDRVGWMVAAGVAKEGQSVEVGKAAMVVAMSRS